MRGEPSPKGRSSFRPWYGNVPPDALLNGTPGGVLGPIDIRRLGGPALALWRLWLDERGYADHWVRVSLKAASRSLGMAERTVDRAKARLVEAGLVDAVLVRSKVVDQWGAVSRETWTSVLNVRVFGGIDPVGKEEHLWVPSQTLAWCDHAPSWGGDRPGSGRPRANQVGALLPGEAENGGPESTTYVGKMALPREVYIQAPLFGCSNQTTGRQEPPGNLPGKARGSTSVIKAQRVHTKPLLITAEELEPRGTQEEPIPPVSFFRTLVDAYNHASLEVYGKHGRVRVPDTKYGTVKSPLYEKLLAGARVLAEHAIPPREWAIWAAQVGKAAQERRCVTPRLGYITAIFAPAWITKRRGWFRKEAPTGFSTALVFDEVQVEQHWRRREAQKLARGFSAEGALLGLEVEYAKMRRAEIMAGYADPMFLYPRARSTR